MNIGRLNENGEEYDVMRRMMVVVCCLQKARWRAQCSRMLGMVGRRFRLWWSGRVGDKVMAVVLVLENILRLICWHALYAINF